MTSDSRYRAVCTYRGGVSNIYKSSANEIYRCAASVVKMLSGPLERVGSLRGEGLVELWKGDEKIGSVEVQERNIDGVYRRKQ